MRADAEAEPARRSKHLIKEDINMLLSKSLVGKSHYEVLSVKEDASYDDIRASYKAAVLNSHPDKLQTKVAASMVDHDLQERFLNVQKAWEVLCDSRSRANYDKELRAVRRQVETPAAEVSLRDMTVETVNDVQELRYECRCGDHFAITSLELEELGISLNGNEVLLPASASWEPVSVLLPCSSCSLKIELVID